MTAKPKLNDITPMVPVRDFEDGIRFFRDILGFDVLFRLEDRHAYLKRDQVAVRFIPAPTDPEDDAKRAGQFHCYVDVDRVDGVYESMKSGLETLPAGFVRPPFDTAWGTREFHVAHADGLLLSFGEPKI